MKDSKLFQLYKHMLSRLFYIVLLALTFNSELRAQSYSEKAKIITQILENEEVMRFYHFNVLEERLPLKVAISGFVKKPYEITSFGHKVIFKTLREFRKAGQADYILIDKVESNGDRITLHLFYEVEGMYGDFEIVKDEDNWKVELLEIGEY